MRTLAIETATPACSVALFDGEALVDARHETLGRGHAERLVPMIAELPDKGEAERILVSLGPGSFTGTRIGIAAARALGLAWRARVVGYPTLALVAAGVRNLIGETPVLVVMTGGHGEWFVQPFDGNGLPLAENGSLASADAASSLPLEHVGGSEAAAFIEQRGWGQAHPMLPDARWTPALPAVLLTTHIAPIYGRPPDAKPATAVI
jgi:tRNA threonylcarbamoyl adenosine modification protein YeaZ